jgi:hypothetical protein
MKTHFGDDPAEPLIFAGYGSDNIEFANVFNDNNLTGQPLRDRFEALVQTAVTAESGLVPGTFVSILVVGHADRDDTPGRTPEQRRAIELENSGLRAESAEAFIVDRIFNVLQAEGFTAPLTQDVADFYEVRRVAAGSADLVFTSPSGELERMQNRRVQFFGTAFTPPPTP